MTSEPSLLEPYGQTATEEESTAGSSTLQLVNIDELPFTFGVIETVPQSQPSTILLDIPIVDNNRTDHQTEGHGDATTLTRAIIHSRTQAVSFIDLTEDDKDTDLFDCRDFIPQDCKQEVMPDDVSCICEAVANTEMNVTTTAYAGKRLNDCSRPDQKLLSSHGKTRSISSCSIEGQRNSGQGHSGDDDDPPELNAETETVHRALNVTNISTFANVNSQDVAAAADDQQEKMQASHPVANGIRHNTRTYSDNVTVTPTAVSNRNLRPRRKTHTYSDYVNRAAFACKPCNLVFRGQKSLDSHLVSCAQRYSVPASLPNLQRINRPSIWQCNLPLCMRKFTNRAAYRRHRHHHSHDLYSCRKCGKKLTDLMAKIFHVKKKL